MPSISPRVVLAALLALAPLAPGAAAAQTAAEPYTPAEHWSRDAVRHLAALGLLDTGAAAAAWPQSRARVRAWLDRAEAAAEQHGDAGVAALAHGYAARFTGEFGTTREPTGPALAARVAGGWAYDDGVWRAGAYAVAPNGSPVYPGPSRLPEASQPVGELSLDLGWSRSFAASVGARGEGGDARVREATVALFAGGWELWAGRRSLGLGASPVHGLVLSPATPLDGAGASLAEGVRLPGPLNALGPLRATLALARMERSGGYAHPWLAAARVDLAPSPSLAIGFNRAALFGGAGNEGVTVRRIALMALGYTDTEGKDSDFENQVASLDVLWHTAVARQPLLLYGEWAFDDISFAFLEVPALIVGAELPALPGLPALGLGLEHVWFAGSCCGYPPWYHHAALAEGWTDRGAPLGHPLGGEGRQTSLLWRAAAPGAGWLARGRLFLRQRGAENLFAPDLAGGSAGGGLELVGFGSGRLRFRAAGELERTERAGWRGGLEGGVEVSF